MAEKLFEKIKKVPYAAIPIVIVIAIIPLIVHYYSFEAHLSSMSWYVSNDQTGDMFNYYKSEFLVATACLMIAVIFVGIVFCKKYYFHKAMVPLAVYALFIILSTLFSKYQYFSLNGMDNHFETVYVLLSYCLLVLYCYWFTDSEKSMKFVLYAWMIGMAVMCVFGICQLIGHDLYETEFGRILVIPEKSRKAGDEIVFSFAKGTVYLTLYNPNYVGFYAVLTMPILTTLFVFSKKVVLKVISIILNSLILLCLLGAGAKNGMVALACTLVFMLILFRKNLKQHWLGFTVSYISMIVIFFVFNAVNHGMVTERLEVGFEVEKDTSDKLERIDTGEDNVTISYDGNKLILTLEPDETNTLRLGLKDGDGEDVSSELLDTEMITYKITDKRFPFEVSLGKLQGVYGFAVNIEDKMWYFSNQTEYQGYFFYSPYGKFTKIETAETAVFTNYSKLASGRGYLWARTIPLLKDYWFLGSGPDTFTVVFPQKDYVAASKMGYDRLTVTKPHDLYLQIGTQTGVVSMIAFLVFNAFYLIEGLILCWKKKADSFLEYMGIAVMAAVVAYLISGIVNDSTVTVAPIYWCLMGMGLSLNRLIKKQREAG